MFFIATIWGLNRNLRPRLGMPSLSLSTYDSQVNRATGKNLAQWYSSSYVDSSTEKKISQMQSTLHDVSNSRLLFIWHSTSLFWQMFAPIAGQTVHGKDPSSD